MTWLIAAIRTWATVNGEWHPRRFRVLMCVLRLVPSEEISPLRSVLDMRLAFASLRRPLSIWRVNRRGLGTTRLPWWMKLSKTLGGLLLPSATQFVWPLIMAVVLLMCVAASLHAAIPYATWAALPTITFDNTNGSDTQASGSGGTALFGTGAATAASTVVTLLVDNPDLSGVDTTGGGVIWIASSSGVQYSKITGVNNTAGVKTVTVQTAYANTESGKTWGIGGKRKTMIATTSLRLGLDVLPGWTITVDNSASEQPAFTSSFACSVAGDTTTGFITLQGVSATSRAVLTSATNNTSPLSGGCGNWRIRNFKFTSTAGTKTNSYGIVVNSATGASGTIIADNCVFGDATNKIQTAIERSAGSNGLMLVNCEIVSTLAKGLGDWSGTAGSGMIVDNCYIHSCSGNGISPTVMAAGVHWRVRNSIITSCTIGINVPSSSAAVCAIEVEHCVLAENSSDGVKFTAASTTLGAIVRNNQFIHNGGYGVNFSVGTAAVNDTMVGQVDYNNFGTGSGTWSGANVSGNYNGKTAGTHDLAVDPAFTSGAGANFTPGAASWAKGYPDATLNVGANNSATLNYEDIGFQHLALATYPASRMFTGQ